MNEKTYQLLLKITDNTSKYKVPKLNEFWEFMGLLFFAAGEKMYTASDLFDRLPDGVTMTRDRFNRLKACFPCVEQPERFVEMCNEVWSTCVIPGFRCIVDESMWRARHNPSKENNQEVVKLERKPGGMGLITYLLCVILGRSGLPYAMYTVPVRFYNRISPGNACIALLIMRLKHQACQNEVHIFIDSAFSSEDVRTFLKCAHLCARQANPYVNVHYTCSANAAWDPIWKVACTDLNASMFRVFQKNDARTGVAELASVFSMIHGGKQVYICRFTNAYNRETCADGVHAALFKGYQKVDTAYTIETAKVFSQLPIAQLRQLLKTGYFSCRMYNNYPYTFSFKCSGLKLECLVLMLFNFCRWNCK